MRSMRVRWDFFYETADFKFERTHKFKGTITKEHATAFGIESSGHEFILTVIPDKECIYPSAEQSGMLHLELPGRREKTEDLAKWLVANVAEQVSFNYGRLKVHSGLIMGEHLPETHEEEAELGEGRYFYEAHLVEVLPTPTFEGSSLSSITGAPEITRTMQHYNAALRASNPVDRFLGLFRIIEDYASRSKHGSLAKAIKQSRPLFGIAYADLDIATGQAKRQLQRPEFNKLVDDFVTARDHCAHLRTDQGLGIAHGDPRVRSEVEPLIEPLRVLCSGLIQKMMAEHTPGSPSPAEDSSPDDP